MQDLERFPNFKYARPLTVRHTLQSLVIGILKQRRVLHPSFARATSSVVIVNIFCKKLSWKCDQVTLEAGDALYIPALWYAVHARSLFFHAVLYTRPYFCILAIAMFCLTLS